MKKLKTKQEIFDYVVTFLLKQGHAAVDEDNNCVYFAANGDRCAIGCLIPRKCYQLDFEAMGITIIAQNLKNAGYELPQFAEKNFKLLENLKDAHDDCFIYAYYTKDYSWEKHFFEIFNKLAKKFGLNTKTLEKKWNKYALHNQ